MKDAKHAPSMFSLWRHVMRRDHRRCQMCRRTQRDTTLSLHHILPRHLGGGDVAENLITLCRPCHDMAETEQLATAELIRNWLPEVDRPKRLERMAASHENVGSAQSCRLCRTTEHTYNWRYFDGPHTGEIMALCLSCYSLVFARGEDLALVLGQQIADSPVSQKRVSAEKRPAAVPTTAIPVLEVLA